MPKYHIDRSITINAPLEKVKASLIDYRQWPVWSPWLVMEPETQLEFSTEQSQLGANYSWDGKLTGSGNMQLTEMTDNQLKMALEFLKPFKSSAKIIFDLFDEGNGKTKVTWNMHSKVPFFLFWMVKRIKVFIGMDYERGLRMLKDYIELENVPSKISVEGVSTITKQKYVGLIHQSSIKHIAEVMEQGFKLLNDFKEEHKLSEISAPFAIYETYDASKDFTGFILALPVDEVMEVKAPYYFGEMEGGKALKILHTGSYKHLGNAWSTGMAHCSAHKLKPIKRPVGLEFYLNDPNKTDDSELQTEVYLPLR